jgi:PPE-repeat protein
MLRWINIYASCSGVAGFGAGMMMSELIRGVGFIGSIPMGIGFSLVIVGLAGVVNGRLALKRCGMSREDS